MALSDASTQLSCGRDIDQVWDHLDLAPDGHELTCPYCQAARADLAGLGRATTALRADDATNPDLQPSPGLLDRVLAVARAEVRRGRRLPLDQTSPAPSADLSAERASPNTISEQAVAAVIRRAGDRDPEVEIRRCSITLDADDTSLLVADGSTGGTDDVSGPDAVSGAISAVSTSDGQVLGGAVDQVVVPTITGQDAVVLPDPGRASVRVSLLISVGPGLAIAATTERLRASVIEAVSQKVGMIVTRVDIVVGDIHDV